MHASPTDIGNKLVAAGQTDKGLAVVYQACDRGDAVALMQAAVWHLAGQIVPRNLATARQFLRRAVEIGHVDAALMEIALTANGSGAPANWSAARRLLDIAAQSDPLAAAHIKLLTSMSIDQSGLPQQTFDTEIISEAPRLVRIRGFLTPDECRHLAFVGDQLLEPSHILDPKTGRQVAHPIRTSDGGAIGPAREDLVVRAINYRIAAATATDINQGESLTILRYRNGQQYRLHVDTISGAKNQRTKTMLIYLNDGFGGGQTIFPAINAVIEPRGGDAVIFDNVQSDGNPEPRSQHAGLPVTTGVKWLATRWIRSAAIDPWTMNLTS